MKKLFLLISIATFAITSFAQNCAVPDAERIAADLVGHKFSESVRGGYFERSTWTFDKEDKIVVSVDDMKFDGEDIKYDITVGLTTPSRAQYIIDAEVRYYKVGDEWTLDLFFARTIVPKKTNAYKECVSMYWDGGTLVMKNHSNIVLAVYAEVEPSYGDDKFVKRMVRIGPNDKENFYCIETYRDLFVERY